MNHDERNSKANREMKAWIEPELEARVVAWVTGEASPFEVAELERLVAEKPELAIFKRRIETVHGLVAEAALPDKEPVRLSEARRTKLLAAIGGHTAASPSNQRTMQPSPQHSRPWWRATRVYYAVGGLAAACLLVLLQWSPQHKSMDRETTAFRAKVGVEDGEAGWKARGREAASKAAEVAQPVALDRDLNVRVTSTKETADARANERSLRAARAEFTPPAESPRAPVGLLAQAQSMPETQSYDTPSLTLGTATPALSASGRLANGGAGRVALSDVVNRDLGSVTLGISRKVGALEERNDVDATERIQVGAVSNETRRFSFGGQQALAQRGNSDSFGAVPATPTPSTSMFGEPATGSKSATTTLSANGAPAGSGASTNLAEPVDASSPRSEPVTLSAFVVTGPKKKDGANTAAGEADDVGARRAVVAIARANPSDGKEELERQAVATVAAHPASTTSGAETNTAKESVSTFSLHVSDVSFRLAIAAVAATARGEEVRMPEIRAEEFYNAFDYGDPAPAVAEKVGARIEQSAHPFLQQRNLLRIAMKVPATGRGASQPLRLTVLLDTSGSMEREDRRMAVRRALEELIALLGPNDRVTLIGFARQPRLLAEAVPGDQAARLIEVSARTPAEGGTNLEQALKVAGELAVRHRLPAAQNRIVLLTDGAANLGNADPAQLAIAVETLRQQGIAFDACGIGLEGVGDNVLEALTRKGDGRYYVIDRPEAADAAFARQLAGAFRPAAENVKLQVRFNPARVGNHRLIGFDQHRLREEDFRNDQVDAAELAAEEAATALYQIEVQPDGSGEIGEVYVRFRDATTGAMVERSWTIRYDPQAPRFDRATPSLQLAGVAALLAEKLSDSPLASQFKLGDFAGVVNSLRSHYAHEARVQELITMYGQLRRIGGE